MPEKTVKEIETTDIDSGIDRALKSAFDAGVRTQDVDMRVSWLAAPGADGPIPVCVNGQSNVHVLQDAHQLLESMRPVPRRRQGNSHHHELASFIEHVNRHKEVRSVIWANQEQLNVKAIYDYDSPGADPTTGGHHDHQAVYQCPRSEAWQLWANRDGKMYPQDNFAQFVEDRFEDIVGPGKGEDYPQAVQLLEMARDLVVKTAGRFERKVDPRTGDFAMINKPRAATCRPTAARARA